MNNTRYGYPQCSDMERTGECCRQRDMFPDCVSLAMAYIPFQQWCDTYPMEKALCQGTVFPVLDLPFMGGRK